MTVVDTHVLVWWVSDGARLSATARRAIRRASRQTPVVASTITLFEIATAVRRGRLQLGQPLDEWITDLRVLPELRFEPVTAEIAYSAGSLDDSFPGDPADRIIVATARTLRASLVSADQRLRRSPVANVVW